MAVSQEAEAALAAKFAVMRRVLDERQWRVYLGTEARALGYGGIAAVARAAGAAESTVAAGVSEAEAGDELGAARGRARRPGGGRKRLEEKDPRLGPALREVAEAATRGDPMAEITWCSLSLREIARQLAARGLGCGKDAVARMLREDGYSLQGMSRTAEGRQHPDRDAQFRHINDMIAEFTAAGDPVVSVDAKKKEQLGPFHRAGRSWRPAGDPVKVRDHDFPDQKLGKITPYGIYDIAANRGFVSVGTSHDTAAFAVNALRLWWQQEGTLRYGAARRLLVVCDAGGSNDYRCRLWKDQLTALAAETGLRIEVCHFPPGTSKWNKIEHRLFCHITRTWRARPLMTAEDAVAGIAATVTAQGLKCTAVLDDGDYPDGVKVSDARVNYLEDRVLDRGTFHGEWNYAVLPAPRPAPGPDPGPDPAPARPARVPAAILNHPALTGLQAGDLTALAQALHVPFEARLQQRNYTQRRGPRVNAVRTSRTHAGRRLDITDHLLALRLRDHLGLPLQVIAVLLGVDPTTISHATALAAGLLAAARITPQASSPPASLPRTPAALLAYAAQAGIPLTIPDNGQTMPDHFRTRRNRPPATRPTRPTK